MPLRAPSYRIKSPITAILCNGTSERLHCLNRESILVLSSEPDAAGMIEAKWEGSRVRVFERDLFDRAEEIDIDHDLFASGS